jgi:4-amino-4-deoxy-L-arabinose transferase-like glycosyltransferase
MDTGAFYREHTWAVRWALAIFVIALGVRLVFVLWLDPDPTYVNDDSWFYRYSAKAMVDGDGYVYPGRLEVTADHPPGYTALLASVFLLPGPDWPAGQVLNSLIGALGCSLLFLFGLVAFGRAIGVAAGLLLTFFPSHIAWTALPVTEVTYSTLTTAVLLLVLWTLRRGTNVRWPHAAIAGIALGLSTMVRGEGLLLFLLVGAVWWITTRSLRRAVQLAGIAALGIVLAIGPWTVRNAVQLHAFVPISTGHTVLLAISHWDGADGGGNWLRSTYVTNYYPEEPFPAREVKRSQKQMRDAVRFAFTHPSKELSLIPQRVFHLYENDSDAIDWIAHYPLPVGESTVDRLRVTSDAYYFGVGLAALPGVVLLWRRRPEGAVLVGGTVLYLTALMGIVYFGAPRYHASLMPLFCLAAAPIAVGAWSTAAAAYARAANRALPSPTGLPDRR